MRGFDLLEQLSLVDREYLEAAEAAPSPVRRRSWQRWSAAAACAVLLLGLGVWGTVREKAGPGDMPEIVPDIEPAIDIAPVEPGQVTEPGMKTIPGFETLEDGMAVYHILPWLGYGEPDGGSTASIAVPEDCTGRSLTEADILALVGGENALNELLAWEGMELTGTVYHHADGRVWVLDLWGESAEFAFSLKLAPEELPVSCVVVPTDYVTEVWGVEVAGRTGGAYGRGENREVWMPESRTVEFVANDVGCRFQLYGLEGQGEAVETMVSRFVRQAILEGLDLSAVEP